MLIGRDTELARIAELLAGARRADGGILTLRGEPGIGKSALLDAGRDLAAQMPVVATRALEAESELGYSALAELAEPLLGELGALPAPQRAAIEGALARGPAVADRFAVCAAAQRLLAAAAERAGLLVIVDDAQWLDAASAECLAYAARRLEGTRVAMLVAAREGERDAFEGAGESLDVAALDRASARALLEASAEELSAAAEEQLLGAAAGNPLALRELPSLLSEEERRGVASLEPVARVSERLQRAFGRRLERLSEPARRAALVAAAAGSRSLTPIVAACESLAIDRSALEEAEAAGVCSLAEERIEFSHPLLLAAAYRGAPAAERRQAHRALAAVGDEEGRGWHLAAAAIGADPEAVAALESSAAAAASRGAHSIAAGALARAAALSEAEAARALLLLRAAKAASAAGEQARALALLDELPAGADPLVRRRASHLRALVLMWDARDVQAGCALLESAAEEVEASDPVEAATLLADAAVGAASAGNFRRALASAERARALLGDAGDAGEQTHVLSVLGWNLATAGRSAESKAVLARVDELIPQADPSADVARSIGFVLNSRIPCEEYERIHAETSAIIAGAREAGLIGVLPFPLLIGADAAFRLGEWDAAAAQAAEAVALSEETAQRGALALANVALAQTAATRGEEEDCRAAVAATLEIAEPAGLGAPVAFATCVLGVLELGLGRIDEAIAALEFVGEFATRNGLVEPTLVPWAPHLVEAYVQAGRRDDALRVSAELDRAAERSQGTLAAAYAARCRGLVAEEDFRPHFERALELHGESPVPLERARTQLVFGGRLHREMQRLEARKLLREALAEFERLGARPWLERTRAELRAAGAIERAPATDPDELTAQEVRVASAVARGATNREVASELFLSPKTIEFHLGRVYRKLGISSRTELATLVAEGRVEVPSAPGPWEES